MIIWGQFGGRTERQWAARSLTDSHGAVGRLRPDVEQLIADPGTLAAATRLLLDLHFTPSLAAMICDAVGLDLAVLELAASPAVAAARRSVRRSGFAEEVLRAYAYQCAMCGFPTRIRPP